MSLSACVTRILSLSGFPPELKTRDIQSAFAEFENERGGFKIKWIDDTSLLVVFSDPVVAKRAYLQTLISPPPLLTSPTSDTPFILRPYDGPDAQTIIASVNQRAAAQGGGHRTRPSLSTNVNGNGNGHTKRQSAAWKNKSQTADAIGIPAEPLAREPSPTLPTLPNHPTLGSLISSAHPDLSANGSAEGLVSS